MKNTILKLLLLIPLCFGNKQFMGQTLKQTIIFADSALQQNNAPLSIKLYTRILYFAPDSLKPKIFEKLAFAYYSENKFIEAEKYFKFASFSAKDSTLNDLLLKISATQILQKKFLLAQQTLYALPDSLPIYQQRTKNFQFGTLNFGIANFIEAEKYFLKVLPDSSSLEKEKIKSYFAKKKYLYRPNPNLVFYSSLFVPGSGQIITGDYQSSLNSIFLLGALSGLSVLTLVNYGLADAILTVFPWFFRYYQGGAIKAETKAKTKLQENRALIYHEITNLMIPYLP